jgi:hypothetical protein
MLPPLTNAVGLQSSHRTPRFGDSHWPFASELDEAASLVDDFLLRGQWVGQLEGMMQEHVERMHADAEASRSPSTASFPGDRCLRPAPSGDAAVCEKSSAQDAQERKAQALQQLGAMVYLPEDSVGLDWTSMAGYEEQKRAVEEIVLMSITHADEFAEMAKRTRKSGKCERAKVCPLYLQSSFFFWRAGSNGPGLVVDGEVREAEAGGGGDRADEHHACRPVRGDGKVHAQVGEEQTS